jgi:hypothetical protein
MKFWRERRDGPNPACSPFRPSMRATDEQHASFARGTAQEMLRPLKHEVPAEMGQTHDVHGTAAAVRFQVPCRSTRQWNQHGRLL